MHALGIGASAPPHEVKEGGKKKVVLTWSINVNPADDAPPVELETRRLPILTVDGMKVNTPNYDAVLAVQIVKAGQWYKPVSSHEPHPLNST